MSELQAARVADWCQGTLRRGNARAEFTGVTIDSRQVGAGELFVAIAGPRHDGHEHVGSAAAAGATGAVVRRGFALPVGLPDAFCLVEADDTTRALGAIAAGHRALYRGPLVAITGSNGKTSTKEMCAAILSVRAPCLKTAGNLNNEYGLPLTLLRRKPEHACVVVELGMNHRGEIARLAAIAQPTVGVLGNVGTAHIEHLGSREAIAEEKGDLLAALPASGVAVANADDPLASAQAGRSRARALRFGLAAGADVRGSDVRALPAGYAFRLRAPQGETELVVAVSPPTHPCAAGSSRSRSSTTCSSSTTPTTRIRSRWRWRCARSRSRAASAVPSAASRCSATWASSARRARARIARPARWPRASVSICSSPSVHTRARSRRRRAPAGCRARACTPWPTPCAPRRRCWPCCSRATACS